EGCRIEPLQIVEEQRERMFGPREDGNEPSQHQLESKPGILRRQCWHWRLLADDVLQIRYQVDDQLPVRSERVLQVRAPLLQIRFALGKELADKTLEGLRQRRIRDVGLVLVELA